MPQRYVDERRRTTSAAVAGGASVGPVMEDASPATFRPTWAQAMARGLYLGALISMLGIVSGALATIVAVTWTRVEAPPPWLWAALAFGPLVVGALLGPPIRRRTGTQICAGGIRILSVFEDGLAPWNRVVDLRAERRGGRTVVSVYLDSGTSLQLQAPYTGELFAADPHFESKMFALSHLWRSHRFGGLPG
jgi:hypothetical protein